MSDDWYKHVMDPLEAQHKARSASEMDRWEGQNPPATATSPSAFTATIVYRDEVENDMEGWKDEYGTLPAGWYRLDGPNKAFGPFKTRELAVQNFRYLGTHDADGNAAGSTNDTEGKV